MSAPRFNPGERVCVRAAFPPGHVRTPHYTRGRCGVVEALAGSFANPEELAYGRSGAPAVPLYRVRFEQSALWPDYAGPVHDTLLADIFEHWLEPERAPAAPRTARRPVVGGPSGPTRSGSRLKPLPRGRRSGRKGAR